MNSVLTKFQYWFYGMYNFIHQAFECSDVSKRKPQTFRMPFVHSRFFQGHHHCQNGACFLCFQCDDVMMFEANMSKARLLHLSDIWEGRIVCCKVSQLSTTNCLVALYSLSGEIFFENDELLLCDGRYTVINCFAFLSSFAMFRDMLSKFL